LSASKLDTAICVPSYRANVHTGHLYQLAALLAASGVWKFKLGLHFADSSNLDWGRNMLLWTAIREGYDWCLFVDADTFCTDGAAIVRMLETANAQNAPVVAAPVKMRGRPGYNVVSIDEGGKPRLVEQKEFKDQIAWVRRVGTAFMAVRCGWIVKNWSWHTKADAQPWFQTVPYLDDATGKLMPAKMGEDYGFCDGVYQRGGRILIDGRFEPQHIHSTSELAGVADLGFEIMPCPSEPLS